MDEVHGHIGPSGNSQEKPEFFCRERNYRNDRYRSCKSYSRSGGINEHIAKSLDIKAIAKTTGRWLG